MLTLVPMLWADPVISEFLASNQSGIRDENGDRSDWIEIRNPSALPVNMDGWYLTDVATNLIRWRFPAVQIPARGHLLVWASGKDRRVAGQPLHTNFSLAASGEYLALVRPDGVTRQTEFAPTFPQQFPDVSYGASIVGSDVTLVQQSTPVRAFVPTSDALGATWRAPGFNDTAWTAGTFAVGYFNSGASPNLSADLGVNFQAQMSGNGRNSYSRARFTVSDPSYVSKLTLRVNYDDGFSAFVNGTHVAASPNGVPTPDNLRFNSACGNHGPGTFEDFDVSAQIGALVAGENVLAIQGLNTSTTSSDAFILPQLIARLETGSGPVGYFPTPTPGLTNGGPDTQQLPQTVVFSRPSGPFVTAFDLTLGGATAGQVVRYTLSDPTTTPAANLAEPTATSAVAGAPLAITSNKLIRAAVFDSATGLKGPTTTSQYLLLESGGTNNSSNFTSTLPLLVADLHGATSIVDSGTNTYTNSLFYVFPTVNGVASLNSTPALFSRAGIRIRGSSSAGFPKKSYGLELWNEKNQDLDQPLLGMASDSDWILNGPYQYDDTYIHNAFIYEVSRRVGRWAPRTQFVEMFVSQNGGLLDYQDYAGVYVLTEKIKSKSDRLDITPLQPGDNSGEAVTGGYIFKIDRAESDEVSWQTATGVPNSESGQKLVIVEPDPDVDTPEQIGYLRDNYIASFDATLASERTAGFTTRNYRNYIDLPSFVDHHILNSLAYNVDALRLSAFYFKDRSRKINAGPIWDFDRALGSDDGRDANPQSWNNIGYFFTRDWWGGLFQDPDFVQAWVDRWWQLRAVGGAFQTAQLTTLATQMGSAIGNTIGARDAAKWPQNAPDAGQNYLNEITKMNTWLTNRVNWIDSQVPTPPSASVASNVVAPGTTVTLAGTGTLRYTLNGSDPRPAGGGASSPALTYSSPITINQTTVLTVRRQQTTTPFPGAVSIGWSAPLTRVYLVNEFFAEAIDLAVSEINYHPLGPTNAEAAALPGVSSEDFEFVELRNIGTRKVNLFEVRFAEGNPVRETRLNPFTLAPGEFAFVVKNRAAFELRYGTAQSGKIVGEWVEGSLANDGENIQIFARNGSPVQNFTYGDSGDWPGRADGKGSTLEYVGEGIGDTYFNQPGNWRASAEVHGSPGAAGSGPDTRVVINEILSNSTSPRVDAIEVRNTDIAAVDVSGWFLSNSRDPESVESYAQFRIPNGTVIPAGGYLTFTEAQFNANGAWNPNGGAPGAGEFSFDAHRGGVAMLLQASASGPPAKFMDRLSFGASRAGESWGRWPDATGGLYPMTARTLLDEASAVTPRPGLGAPNSLPRVGPVIVSEFHPSPPGGNNDLEFVELRNPTATPHTLTAWRLRGEVDFDFPPGTTIAPGAFLVLVRFDPADSAKATAFRNAFGITAAVPLLGPWLAGNNLGSSGRIVLYRGEAPPPGEPAFYPQTIEDETNYRTSPDWPVSTGGYSLNRRGTAAVGDLGASWRSDVPSPGSASPTYTQWRSFHFPGGGPGTGDAEDFDGDGASNAREFALATAPKTAEPPAATAPVLLRHSSGTSYTFAYQRPADRVGVQYQVQTSPNLSQWDDVSDALITSAGGVETRQAVVPIPENGGRLFFRLRMIITP